MNHYKAVISKIESGYYALVVKTESDGYQRVHPGYKGKQFKTLRAAERSTAKFIKKYTNHHE